MRTQTIFSTVMLSAVVVARISVPCFAQQSAVATKAVIFTVQEDHQNMMQQLGITKLRPGPSGNAEADNAANYDEALANPYSDLLTFVSYGIPERGDANWLDHQGSFMAAIAAQPVYRLLGAKDLGRTDDYKSEKMPAVNIDMLDGALAWRQHDGGHTDAPNIEHFIHWADKHFAN